MHPHLSNTPSVSTCAVIGNRSKTRPSSADEPSAASPRVARERRRRRRRRRRSASAFERRPAPRRPRATGPSAAGPASTVRPSSARRRGQESFDRRRAALATLCQRRRVGLEVGGGWADRLRRRRRRRAPRPHRRCRRGPLPAYRSHSGPAGTRPECDRRASAAGSDCPGRTRRLLPRCTRSVPPAGHLRSSATVGSPRLASDAASSRQRPHRSLPRSPSTPSQRPDSRSSGSSSICTARPVPGTFSLRSSWRAVLILPSRSARPTPASGMAAPSSSCPLRHRIAEVVRGLAVEADPSAVDVQPGAHAIAALRRRVQPDVGRQRELRNSRERVFDEIPLERQLAVVGDVRVDVAAAECDRLRRRAGRASQTSMDSARANTTPPRTNSTRAVTCSPGIVPDTNTIWPSCRASMRPPAAGFSMSSAGGLPGAARQLSASAGRPSRARNARSTADAIACRHAAAGIRSRKGSRSASACACSSLQNGRVDVSARGGHEDVDRRPRGGRSAPRAPAPRVVRAAATQRIELGDDRGEHIRRNRRRRAATKRRQPRDGAFERRRQAVAPLRLRLDVWCDRQTGRHADGAPPGVERLEHVVLAVVDVHGPAARSLRVVALEARGRCRRTPPSAARPARPSC